MDQREFPFFKRVDAPAVAPEHWVKHCKTYRQAVLTAWVERTMKGATAADMCRNMNFRAQHVSDWFAKDNAPGRRSLPAHLIPDFESYVGNTLVSHPALFVGLAVDFVVNVVFGSLVFLQVPREMTLSRRLWKLSTGPAGWRQRWAFWIRTQLLDAVDPSGIHKG